VFVRRFKKTKKTKNETLNTSKKSSSSERQATDSSDHFVFCGLLVEGGPTIIFWRMERG